MMVTIQKIKLVAVATAICFASSAFAAGFGVTGGNNATQKNSAAEKTAAINQLLAQARADASSTRQQQSQDSQSGRAQASSANNDSSSGSSTGSNVKATDFGNTGVSRAAFTKMIRNLMPLSPAQIRTLRDLFDKSQRAAATYPGTPPRPTTSTVVVNLSPGATPPVIRLRAGFVTALVFVDSTGKSWPIKAYDLGDPKAFNVQWNQKSNTLLVQALDTYKSGDLAVMLKGKDTPVMVTLMPGQRAVDYRVDLRVPGLGPNAKPGSSGLPSSANPQLVNFLDGVPPSGSQALQVTGGPSQAWLYHGHVYLRTQLTVLSPGWLSSMSSPDGTHVYEMTKTPIVLASFRGQLVQLKIKGV